MSVERVPFSSAIAESPGLWLAVNRTTNEPVLAAETPCKLVAEIRRLGLTNVAVIRAPEPSEPELVGVG